MQHERFFALTFDRIDDLGVTSGTQCRSHDRLRFAAGKDCRTVCARQYADLHVDRTYGTGIAAVNSRLARYDTAANDILFQL